MLDAGTIVGSYRIEGALGRGGMSVVYSARHVELGRLVALKVLADELGSDPEFVARFRREGRAQAALDHPHVVTVYEAGESEHGLYLAMHLVPGSTLAALSSERTLDAAQAVALLRQAADALDAAHAAGLVHRDVKPQNVLVADSDAYLGDFGLTSVGGAAGVTATGKLVGTISYLAPEVIHGREAVPASDRYAFAAMLFECLTGTVVFPRRTEAAILYAHTSEPPPRISGRRRELPQELDAVFARALAKDPGDRPGSAVALVDGVADVLERAGAAAIGPPPPAGAEALDGTTVEALPAGEPSRRTAPLGRRMAPWLAGAALLGAAVAAGITALVVDGEESEAAAVPPPLAGARVLGSDLAEPGRPLDCRGRAPRPSSPGCTIVQAQLPGRTVVAPADGAIRRWAVRSARGELALVVVRPRGREALQVARSQNEFVSNDGVHVFEANLAVERGDRLGLVVVAGSGVGARTGAEGAATTRWIPRLAALRPADLGAGTGFDAELLLRVEHVPGGVQKLPKQISGAEAADLPPGRALRRSRLRYPGGRRVEVALVALGSRFVLDQFVEGRRTVRIDVPDFRPKGGQVITFEAYVEPGETEALGVYIEYVNDESSRVLDHFFGVFPREIHFVD